MKTLSAWRFSWCAAGRAKTMAMAQRATKLTMMAMTTTMVTSDDKDDGDGATGDSTTGYDDG